MARPDAPEPGRGRAIRAHLVHLLTATGAGLALMAILAAGRGDWREMFLWLLAGLAVDGIDGPLARKAHVKTCAPRWSGDILDLVIDYLSYVMIPAYALAASGLIGPGWSLAAGLLISVTGAVYFADTRMKTSDKSFRGFPACWNMVLLVLFAVDIGDVAAVVLVGSLAVAQFLPLKVIHPVRTMRWRRFSLAAMLVWSILALWVVWTGFEVPVPAAIALGGTSLYLMLAGVAQQLLRRDVAQAKR